MPIVDKKCDVCGHTEMDQFEPRAGLPDYGNCIECAYDATAMVLQGIIELTDPVVIGKMRQMLCAPNFNMNGTISGMVGRSGRTQDGTRWEVASRPRKYCPKTQKFGGEIG